MTRKKRLISTLALLAVFSVMFFSGCMSPEQRLRLHRPEVLPEDELSYLLERMGARKNLLKAVCEEERNGPGHVAEGSYMFWWIPMIYSRSKHTDVCRGRVPYVENIFFHPDLYSAPSHIRSARPDEEWIYAWDFLSLGLFSYPYFRETEAAFDMEGMNFRYERSHTVVAGALWRYRYTAKTREEPREETVAGILFTAFGYGRRVKAGQVTTSLRFLWIPIPIRKRAVVAGDGAG